MRRFVVDTNVPVVANSRSKAGNVRTPSNQCRKATIEFLIEVLNTDKVLLDTAGEIQDEYHKHLNPRGQPGVGDLFYLQVLRSAPSKIERHELPKGKDGEYVDLPRSLIEANFDRSDRKFAALAKRTNATDSDWLIHRKTMIEAGIRLKFVCGLDRARWFVE